jgi:hypothetical protein
VIWLAMFGWPVGPEPAFAAPDTVVAGSVAELADGG